MKKSIPVHLGDAVTLANAAALSYGLLAAPATAQQCALNLALFLALASGPVAFIGMAATLAVTDKSVLRRIREQLPAAWFEVLHDTVWIAALAMTGHFFAAGSVLLQSICHYTTYSYTKSK